MHVIFIIAQESQLITSTALKLYMKWNMNAILPRTLRPSEKGSSPFQSWTSHMNEVNFKAKLEAQTLEFDGKKCYNLPFAVPLILHVKMIPSFISLTSFN